MRIAYLSTFYPYKGGIAQFNASLYKALEKEHEIQAFNYKRQYPKLLFPGKSQYVSEKDSAIKIDSKRILDSINPISYYKTAKEIEKYKPDLILTKIWIPFLAPSLGYVTGKLRKKGVKAVSILGNVKPHESRIGDVALTKYYLNRNDGFVSMAKSVREDLLELKPDANYIDGYHPPYEHIGKKTDKAKARENLGIPQDKKVLIFFGFIRKYKGLDVLLEAFGELDNSYHLIIAGESYSGFEEYQKIIDSTKTSDRIRKEIRYVNDDEAALFFSASDLCVLPYRSATQSGIVGISFNFNVPVIATNRGGLQEMIEPWNAGVVLDDPEPKLFQKAIVEFFESDTDYQANIKKCLHDLSWENLSKKVVDFSEGL